MRASLGALTLRAPVAGRLTGFTLQPGQTLKPGDPVGQIDDETASKLTADLDEFYLGRVEPGQHATADTPDGLLSSQTRQARDQAQRDRLTVEAVRRQVVRETAQAWSALTAARDTAAAYAAQVRAAELALAGAQAEYAFALRTTLDVLLTDQALRSAQLAFAQSRHDDLVAQAMLLSVIGGLDGPG